MSFPHSDSVSFSDWYIEDQNTCVEQSKFFLKQKNLVYLVIRQRMEDETLSLSVP